MGEAHGGVVTSCFGRASYKIELTNIKSGQVDRIPNVITVLSRKIIAIQKLTSIDDGVEINPTSIEARTSVGKAPDYAVVSIGLQFKEKSQGEKLIKEIQRITRKNLGSNLKARIKKEFYRPPVNGTEPIKRFFEGVQNLANLLEVRVKPFDRVISSDICYVPEGIPVLDGLGPIGGSTRTPNEYIIQDSLVDRAALLALIINRSARGF